MPVCVLSARDEVDDRVRGLQAGADDYVVKPFALRGGRRAAARAAAPAPGRRGRGARRPATCGSTRARAARSAASATLDLTRREFELLALFMRHPGEVARPPRACTRRSGATPSIPGTNVADVFVGYLRRKLEADGEPRVLHTVRGVGFVLRS